MCSLSGCFFVHHTIWGHAMRRAGAIHTPHTHAALIVDGLWFHSTYRVWRTTHLLSWVTSLSCLSHVHALCCSFVWRHSNTHGPWVGGCAVDDMPLCGWLAHLLNTLCISVPACKCWTCTLAHERPLVLLTRFKEVRRGANVRLPAFFFFICECLRLDAYLFFVLGTMICFCVCIRRCVVFKDVLIAVLGIFFTYKINVESYVYVCLY